MHPPAPAGDAAALPPLSPAHLQQIEHARAAARRVRRTVGVAKASAWTTGILGGLTLLGVLFGDLTSLVLGGALIGIAVRESRGAARLQRFDQHAPRHLAINQAVLGAVIVLYAVWQAWGAYLSNGLSAGTQPVGDPKVDAMLADFGSLTRNITIAFYALVALGGGLGCALMSLYYARSSARVAAFVSQTPAWVVQTMRAAA